MSAPKATFLIPTHDHSTTLPLTVATVLAQTVAELEIFLIGDGVTEDLRAVAQDLARQDARVTFLDLPKGPYHGEIYRHDVIVGAKSDAIFYLCDDDLLLPTHVEDLLTLLESANFAQSRGGHIDAEGQLTLYVTDLADPDCVAWHLGPERRNATSFTGAAHSREFYLQVAEPWQTTPADEWPDHFQWKKLMRHPAFVGATSSRMTALQFPSHLEGREDWTPQARQTELLEWAELVASPHGQARIDELCYQAAWRDLAKTRVAHDRLLDELRDAYTQLWQAKQNAAALRSSKRRLRQENTRLARNSAKLQDRLAQVESSRSWRLTAPLRRLRIGR
ncbi:MAG: glycosyltransferase [Nocardioidaceae bacterium]